MSKKRTTAPLTDDRRSPDRTADDAGWEAKVLGRLSRRVLDLPTEAAGNPDLGWERGSLELLRERMNRLRKEK